MRKNTPAIRALLVVGSIWFSSGDGGGAVGTTVPPGPCGGLSGRCRPGLASVLDVEFRILGPLEVADGDRPVLLSGSRERALLAILLIRAGEVVSADRLIDELWGSDLPA